MGATASKPDPNVSLKVIGVGMSRTGTTSFGAALQHLLHGPVYHGGTQLLRSPESHIKQWIEVCRHTPCKSRTDRAFVMDNVEEILSGFVGCTDLPALAYVEELMEIFPNAKVICTVRDPDKWWASMEPMVKKGNLTLLTWIFAPLRTLRCFREFHDVMDDGRFGEIYFRPGEEKKPSRKTYDRHIEHLKAVVPKDKLFFFDVRDGWEPLCRILDVPVPKGVEFPKLNDAQAIEVFMKESVRRGLMAWAGIGLTAAAATWVALKVARVVR
jgi:Sulfotransferase domain